MVVNQRTGGDASWHRPPFSRVRVALRLATDGAFATALLAILGAVPHILAAIAHVFATVTDILAGIAAILDAVACATLHLGVPDVFASVPAVYVWGPDGALARRFDEDDAARRLGISERTLRYKLAAARTATVQ